MLHQFRIIAVGQGGGKYQQNPGGMLLPFFSGWQLIAKLPCRLEHPVPGLLTEGDFVAPVEDQRHRCLRYSGKLRNIIRGRFLHFSMHSHLVRRFSNIIIIILPFVK